MLRRLTSWSTNLRITTKVAICFSILVVIALGEGAMTLSDLMRIERSDQRTVQSFELLDATKSVWIVVLKQESDVRGYLLSHDPDFLDRFREGDVAVQATLSALRRLTVDSAPQRRRVERLAELIATWRSQVFTGDVPASRDNAIGAEGVLGRILRTLEDVKSEDRRDLASNEKARMDAVVAAYWANRLAPLIAVLAAGLLGLVLDRLFARPIARMTDAVRRLTTSDASVVIPYTHWREEIGAIGRALTVFQATLLEADRLREEQQSSRTRSDGERSDLLRGMAKHFEDVVGSVVADVSDLATRMQGSAEALLGHAESTTVEVKTVADVTRQASTTLQDVSLGTQSLSDAVGDVNGRMMQSSNIAEQAVTEADSTTMSIRGLEQSAKEVDVVIALISNIAHQTNLLALNATIEAARAGEAGRGFSIVAGEVKSLAAETSRATVEIRRRIEGIRAAAAGAGEAVDRIGKTIAEMALATQRMSGVLRTQGAATFKIMQGTKDSAHLTTAVACQLETVSAGVVMTREAATGLFASAQALARQSSMLDVEARRFVGSVREG